MVNCLIRLCNLTVALFVFAGCFRGTGVIANSIDTSPGKTVLLSDSRHFIAQDSKNSVALYQFPETTPIWQFSAPASLERIALSSNEKVLLLACGEGSLTMWDVETGNRMWVQGPLESGLHYPLDASFSHDGESCAVGDMWGCALVLETRTGKHLAEIRFPEGKNEVNSVALSPDGVTGFLIDEYNEVYMFQVATGKLTKLGIQGAHPIRFSVDGKYVALSNDYPGIRDGLTILSVHEKLTAREVGHFRRIGHIRPNKDGSFLITVEVDGPTDKLKYNIVGVQVWPGDGKLRELWQFPQDEKMNKEADFSSDSMIGVSEYFMLKTYLTDLRTGATLMSVDNSENWRAWLVASSTYEDGWRLLVWGGIGLAVFGVLVFLIWRTAEAT